MIRWLSLLLALTFIPVLSHSEASKMVDSTLTVSSTASVEVIPDYIRFVIEIEQVKPTQEKAREKVDQLTSKVLKKLKEFNIPNDHIKAQEIASGPKYRWDKNKQTLEGQWVKRIVRVKLYKKEKYTDLVASVSKIGVSRFHQEGAGFDNIDEYRNKALTLAVEKVKTKAEVIAKAFGKPLGDICEVSETGQAPHPRPLMMYKAAASDGANESEAPLEIKPMEIEAGITATFQLKK